MAANSSESSIEPSPSSHLWVYPVRTIEFGPSDFISMSWEEERRRRTEEEGWEGESEMIRILLFSLIAYM